MRSIQLLTLLGRELLGIVHALDEGLGSEDDRGGDHRPGHRTDAGLVDARHHFDAAAPELALVAEIRLLRHRAATHRARISHVDLRVDAPIIGVRSMRSNFERLELNDFSTGRA